MIDHEKTIQRIIKRRTDNELEKVKQYYEELENKFQSDKKRLSKRYDEEVRNGKFDLEIKYQLDEYFSDEHYIIESIFFKIISLFHDNYRLFVT